MKKLIGIISLCMIFACGITVGYASDGAKINKAKVEQCSFDVPMQSFAYDVIEDTTNFVFVVTSFEGYSISEAPTTVHYDATAPAQYHSGDRIRAYCIVNDNRKPNSKYHCEWLLYSSVKIC